jgi:hypothetical protein
MSFAQFVKDNYDQVRDLPNKERMAALSKMYKGGSKSTKPKSAKSKRVKGGVMTAGVLTGAGFPKMDKTDVYKKKPVSISMSDLNLD